MKESIARKDYYQLLGVSPNASTLEIQIAFNDLSRIYDPESRFFADIIDEPITQEQIDIFERIKLAFNTLMDDTSRAKYDNWLNSSSGSKESDEMGLKA